MKKNIRVLLVEDEAISAMLMKKIFADKGWAISAHVVTGEKAIASARTDPPDLIIMDVRLPGQMDGIQTALEIRKESSVPVIFMSGYDDDFTKKEAQQAAPIGYLTKPLDIRKLSNLVEGIIPSE